MLPVNVQQGRLFCDTYVSSVSFVFRRKSACCIHVSATLQALCAVKTPISTERGYDADDEEALLVKSYICQWKQPRSRKESTQKKKASFEKHVYARQKKHHLTPLKDFDPRPTQCQGRASERTTVLFHSLWSMKLTSGLSVLLDPECRSKETTAATSKLNFRRV